MARHASQLLLSLLGLAAALATAALPVFVNPDDADNGVDVPSGFVGLSLEPIQTVKYMAENPVFKQLLRNLVSYNTGPIHIRWGGNSQDEDPAVLEQEDWEAMAGLLEDQHLKDKIMFTIPLDLRTGNATYALDQIDTASGIMPPEAIAAINIGNEPDAYWFQHPKNNAHPNGFEDTYLKQRYWTDVEKIMDQLYDKLFDWDVAKNIYSGPGLADGHQFTLKDISKWASLGKKSPHDQPYTQLLTWHYYAASGRAGQSEPTVAMLMDERRAKVLHEFVKGNVGRCKDDGIEFRMDETNTVSHSGAYGVSNTMAAALWVVNHAFNLMQAQAAGFNVHGAGCSPYSPVLFPANCNGTRAVEGEDDKFQSMCRDSCGVADADAEVNAPYYGLLFLQKVLRNHANLTLIPEEGVQGDGSEIAWEKRQDRLKVHVLTSDTQLRVVLVNKDDQPMGPTDIELFLPNKPNQEYGFGTVIRLEGDGKLNSTVGSIRLGGQKVDPKSGKIVGTPKTCKIQPAIEMEEGTTTNSTGTVYKLTLQPASATVLVIPFGDGLRPGFQELLMKGLDESQKCKDGSSR